MFKKNRAISKNRAIRRKCIDSSEKEDDESGQDEDIGTRIEQVKKKRKLLSAMQNKRGVDSVELIQAASASRRHVTSSEDVAESTPTETSNDGILDQKHRKAMDEYINSKLASSQPSIPSNETTTTSPSNEKSKSLTENALYSEIAVSARNLSGKEVSLENSAERDDSGSGGAVLVAGTGIAEVILPPQERLKLEQETEKAKAARAYSRKLRKHDPAPSLPQAIPNRFSVHSATGQAHRSGMEEPSKMPVSGAEGRSTELQLSADDRRVGFEALKQRHHGKVERKPRNQSSDHKVFKNFVTRQREMKK